MIKKALLLAAILALTLANASAANTVLFERQYINASWSWRAISLDINKALTTDVSSVCTGPSYFDYENGSPGDAQYVARNQIANTGGAVNSTTYVLPVAWTNCRDSWGQPIGTNGVLRSDPNVQFVYSVCNPGYYAYYSDPYTITGCVKDPTSITQTAASNEQGPPLNCDTCMQSWLQSQAPNSASTTPLRGKPVNAANGNEYLTQEDYSGAGSNLLSLARYYNSGNGFVDSNGFNGGWSHNYKYSTFLSDSKGSSIVLMRPDGSSLSFTYDTSSQKYVGPSYLKGALVGNFSGSSLLSFTFTRPDGTIEQYNNVGQLTSISFGQGGTLTFQYNGFPSGPISSVSDGRGHKLTFNYSQVEGQQRITSVTLPDNKLINYGYDAHARLTTVTYQDNAVRTYIYSYVDTLLNKLVGIIDENNADYAYITYDSIGRATSTQFGPGVELTTFSYGGTSTTVTNSLGVQEVMSFTSLVGRPQTQSITTRCDNGCPADGQGTDQFVYDNNGNATAITNKFGVKTCIAYDTARNLPTKVVDNLPADVSCAGALASPPATSRVKTYQWHATFGVPLTVTGPFSKVTATYDSAGRKLTETEYETTDTTGASGASASTTGTPRTTTWTYNSQGSVLTVKAPRTDANATTTFAYDTNQNLTSVTSPAGLVTTFGNYDANGRPQLITAPNGLQTTLAYDARGRTTSVITGGATTTYGYDGVGQLTSSVLPSGVTMTFTYDDAHRLIATADSFGNRVDRTLDTEGNVLQETVTGNGSVLALSRQAVYDQLSRATSLIQAQ